MKTSRTNNFAGWHTQVRSDTASETVSTCLSNSASNSDCGMGVSSTKRAQAPRGRRGFTLVELLVAVAVLLVLAALTLTTLSVVSEEDVAEGARSAQSYTEGARDRAIYRKRPVGIRLLLDPNGTQNTVGNPVVATSLQYIASPSETLKGVLVVQGPSQTNPSPTPADVGQVLISASPPSQQFEQVWQQIRNNRGLISHGYQMPISIVVNASTGASERYMVAWDPNQPNTPNPGRWVLTRPFTGPLGTPVPYELELLPAVLANQEVRELPRDAVINLPDSKLPAFWYNGTTQQFTTYMDVMFSPRGTSLGASSGAGMIHLHICSPEDRERVNVPPGTYYIGKIAPQVIGNPNNSNPERLISINPVTGNITVSNIPQFIDKVDGAGNPGPDNIPDYNQDGNPATPPYDPYILAEFGYTAQ